MTYIEVSARTGHNIKKLFDTIAVALYDSNCLNNPKDKTIGNSYENL